MALGGSCSASGCADEPQTLNGRPTNLQPVLIERPYPLSLDYCQDTASNSTTTPSEVASAQGESSPRALETTDRLLKRSARPAIDDSPLAEMFADSDEDSRVISPSKSARRRMRRQRQRDALKAAYCNAHLVHGPKVVEAKYAGFEGLEVVEAKDAKYNERAHPRSIVTLDQIGFELGGYGAMAGETSHAFLLTTPVQSSPQTPGVLSTRPCLDSPASGASSSLVRTPLRSDASQRMSAPVTPQSYSVGQHFWNASPCASGTSTSKGPGGAELLATSLSTKPPNSTTAQLFMSGAHTGGSASDTLNLLLGTKATPSGDILATLQAAAPEVYEE